MPPQLRLVAVPKRRSPFDALVANGGKPSLDSLPRGSRIGTSSLRRIAMTRYYRGDLEVVPVRGNLDTRLAKLGRGEVDALIVAEAGLERLGLQGRWERLEGFVPAAGQGALAVYARADRDDIARILRAVDDEDSRLELITEKAVLRIVGAGCRTPIGVHAYHEGPGTVIVKVASVSPDYKRLVTAECRGTATNESEAWELAGRAAAEFARRGGLEILEKWRMLGYDSGAPGV
jgi:hydroxymethylbilane synthase